MSKLFKKRELKIDFMRQRVFGYILSAVLLVVSVFSLSTRGLNYGIDFEGGILIEASADRVIDLEDTRAKLSFLRDLSIQTAGTEGTTILIQAQPEADENPNKLVEKIKVCRKTVAGLKNASRTLRDDLIKIYFEPLKLPTSKEL